jgi:sugar lactone lactonase YvrE
MRITALCLTVPVLLCLAADKVGAQAPAGIDPANDAPADSATAARAAWSQVSGALRSGDIATARREAERAATAWPTQQAYLWGRAITAALAGDTAATLAALDSYATLGLGRDLGADSTFRSYRGLRAFRALAARHAANRAPVARSRPVLSLPDSSFYPEGMDYDARTGRYYVASVRHRTIAEVTPGRSTRELWPRGRADLGAILGVRVDTARGVLWATTSGLRQTAGWAPGDSAIAALLRIRIADGAVERRWDLPPSARGHTLGDLAVGPAGDVWLTDSNEPVLYRLRPGADTLEQVTSRLFRSLQGLAPAPDGRALYVADYSHGLLRVDPATGTVTRLEDAPGSTALGCDGIAWDRGAIVAVQNGVAPARIMRFVLDPAGRRIVRAELLDRNSAVADEPTIGAVVGRRFVYVANSQWEKYDDNGVRKPGIALTAPVLLAAPLPR